MPETVDTGVRPSSENRLASNLQRALYQSNTSAIEPDEQNVSMYILGFQIQYDSVFPCLSGFLKVLQPLTRRREPCCRHSIFFFEIPQFRDSFSGFCWACRGLRTAGVPVYYVP